MNNVKMNQDNWTTIGLTTGWLKKHAQGSLLGQLRMLTQENSTLNQTMFENIQRQIQQRGLEGVDADWLGKQIAAITSVQKVIEQQIDEVDDVQNLSPHISELYNSLRNMQQEVRDVLPDLEYLQMDLNQQATLEARMQEFMETGRFLETPGTGGEAMNAVNQGVPGINSAANKKTIKIALDEHSWLKLGEKYGWIKTSALFDWIKNPTSGSETARARKQFLQQQEEEKFKTINALDDFFDLLDKTRTCLSNFQEEMQQAPMFEGIIRAMDREKLMVDHKTNKVTDLTKIEEAIHSVNNLRTAVEIMRRKAARDDFSSLTKEEMFAEQEKEQATEPAVTDESTEEIEVEFTTVYNPKAMDQFVNSAPQEAVTGLYNQLINNVDTRIGLTDSMARDAGITPEPGVEYYDRLHKAVSNIINTTLSGSPENAVYELIDLAVRLKNDTSTLFELAQRALRAQEKRRQEQPEENE